MALPATESFTDSNGVQLTTHNGSWTLNQGDLDIYSNQLRTDDGGAGRPIVAHWDGDTFSDDQYAKLTVTSVASDYHYLGPAVRVAASDVTAYGVYTMVDVNQTRFRKIIAGVVTTFSTSTVASGSVLQIEANGTTIRYLDDSVQVDSVTDSAIASGSAGLYGWDWSSGNNSNTLGDNWEGGNLGEAPAAVSELMLMGVG